jgi:hypothetical protein
MAKAIVQFAILLLTMTLVVAWSHGWSMPLGVAFGYSAIGVTIEMAVLFGVLVIAAVIGGND